LASIWLDWPDSAVALVTIDQQERMNALTYDMFRALATLWPELQASPARAVVVTGAGNRAFCSGADLRQDVGTRPDEIDRLIDLALLKTTIFTKPLIAAVNGHAAGGGLELVLSADVRAVADRARLAFPEVMRAIFPSGGAALKLVAQIGYPAAMDLLLTGRTFGAEEAVATGLVNAAMPQAQVLPWCLERARRIAGNSPVAVQAVKRFAAEAVAESSCSLLPLEADLVRSVRASRDAAEGRAAFAEKRQPVWENTPGRT
jgi:enoyl-CoA hydratase/carnithine racemase